MAAPPIAAPARAESLRSGVHYLFPAVVLGLAVLLRVSGLRSVELLQFKVFDAFQNLRPRPYAPAPVRIVDIDDESLAKLGQWPWPRTLLARLVARLEELGASVIAFDAVFPEPDRTSPGQIVKLWPRAPDYDALRRSAAGIRDHDQAFAEAIAKAKVVTGFILHHKETRQSPALKAGFSYAGEDPARFLPHFSGAVVNLPVIDAAAAGSGSFSVIPDFDGIIRRDTLLFRMGEAIYPALALEALRVFEGAAGIAVKSAATGVSQIKVGSRVIPTDAEGRFWVRYTSEAPERTVPAWRVLERDFPGDKIRGAIVFVGTGASGLKDLRATPLNPAAPGVEVHAQVAEQVLLGHFLHRPDWADGAEVVYLLLLGAALIALLPRLGAAWCALLAFFSVGLAFAASWRAFAAWHWLLDPLFPSLVIVAVYMSSSLIAYLRSEGERRQVRKAFSHYMAPAMVERLAENPEQLKLGGEMRRMTFHFCDIEGFTRISEFYEPPGLIRFLNQYLTPMSDIILKHRGTIDKYIGDNIMAFWNAPLDDPKHAENACLAVLEMHERLRSMNEERRSLAEGKPFMPVRIRTGLSTGECIVGNMGSEQRFSYSVIGDEVNLASRLEGANKFFHTYIMAAEATVKEAADAVEAREIGLVRVVGKSVPIRVYELLAKKGGLPDAWQRARPIYDKGLQAFRARDFAQAASSFKEVLEALPQDGPSAFYLNASTDYQVIPPPDDWDGVINLTAK